MCKASLSITYRSSTSSSVVGTRADCRSVFERVSIAYDRASVKAISAVYYDISKASCGCLNRMSRTEPMMLKSAEFSVRIMAPSSRALAAIKMSLAKLRV